MSKIPAGRSRGTPAHVIAARYVSGRDLDGRRRTNATFLRHGDKDLTEHGRASRWAHRRHADRAAVRIIATLAVTGFAYGYATARAVTLVTTAAVTGAAALALAVRVTFAVMNARHNRRVVRPLYRTLAPHAYHSRGDNHKRIITVPRNYATNRDAVIRLNLSDGWEGTPGQKGMISTVINNRLGGDWHASWNQDVFPPHVIYKRLPEPPERVTLAEMIPVINRQSVSSLILGMGASAATVAINLDSESPHIALSMGTGGGKTDTTAGIIAQLVRKNVPDIHIIDPKRVSHNWAAGLPGVTIHRYVENQAQAISDVRKIMDERYVQMETNPETVFERIVLVIEEQNSLITDLTEWWDDYRRELTSQERGRTSRVCPAIRDLGYILNKGRQCRVNVISIYQRMSAKAAGNGDMRENYGAKILARYSHQTWKMLVGTTPVPRSSRVPGRAMVVIGDEHRSVQRIYAGIANPDGSANREGIARLRIFALNGRPDTVSQPGPREPVSVAPGATEPERMTLREACESNVIPISYGAARKARQRDREFPPGVAGTAGQRYTADELSAWHKNRVRSAS